MRVARCPKWLLTLLKEPDKATASGIGKDTRASKRQTGSLGDAESIPEGQRNVTLASLGGAMRYRGMCHEAIEAALLAENTARCEKPLPVKEVKTIAASMSRYAPGLSHNSILASHNPRAGGLPETFEPVDLHTALKTPEPDIKWLMEGYLGPGLMTLLYGDPKGGKTTLVTSIARAVATGQECLGVPVRQGKVLFLAVEEHPRDVKNRFRPESDDIEPGMIHLAFAPLVFSGGVMDQIAAYIDEHEIALVVVDTLPMWWQLEDENNAAEVIRKGQQLLTCIRSKDAAWLCLSHTRKSGGEHGKGARGSSALVGLVDIAVHMKRIEGHGRQRCLEALSRYSETPKSMIVKYGEEGYANLGTPEEVSLSGKTKTVEKVLSHVPQTIKQIAQKAGLSPRDVQRCLDELGNVVKRKGKGQKNSPYTYRLKSIQARAHSKGKRLPETNRQKRQVVDVS